MNKKSLFVLSILAVLITGCFNNTTPSSSNQSQDKESSSTTSSETSEISSSSSSELEKTATIEIYASNDIHGAVMEDTSDYRCGIGKYATYFKEKGEQPNTLLLDQGDTWQGSIYSNYNHGELITDVMNYIHFDARTIGNHDFDWGVEYVKTNTAKKYNGYATPVLAGNVYDYNFDTKVVGTTQQSDIGIKSVTYTLENGVKVGILGCIGQDQITSISSNFTMDIAFTNHIDFIKSEALYLRNDENCDVVICSIHTGEDSVRRNGLSDYVDLVLCGHTHRREYSNDDNLYYVQSAAYTKSFSHVTLTFDKEQKDVTNTKVEYVYGQTISETVTTIDSGVQGIIDSYVNQVATEGSQVVANNVTSEFSRYGYAENLMAKAIYDQAVSEGHNDICLSFLNEARNGLPSQSWTYSDLYESFPFDNKVYIAEITGSEFLNEIVNWNYIYRSPSFTSNYIDPNGTYKIAVIDFIYLHTNKNRYYDFFPTTGGTSTTMLSKTYRVILKDWLVANQYNSGKTLNPSDYETSSWSHDRTVFTSI